MLADRQTHRQTDRRVDHNTPHTYRGGVLVTFNDSLVQHWPLSSCKIPRMYAAVRLCSTLYDAKIGATMHLQYAHLSTDQYINEGHRMWSMC